MSPTKILFHRRPVQWMNVSIDAPPWVTQLRRSAGSIGVVSNITQYGDQIERLISGGKPPVIISTDETVEDPSAFAMEAHLEDFLVANWSHTELGKDYDIYEDNGQKAQQYPTDTGRIDILAVSKDKKTLLVVELKKGKAADVAVGQTLRYMGFVKEELAEENQTVRGLVIALEDDQRIRRALSMMPNIEFWRYQVSFKLVKG